MANQARRAIVARAVKANRPSTGGTSAPRSTASAPNVAPAHGFQMGISGASPASIYGKQQGAIAPPAGAAPAPASGPAPTPWSSAYELAKGNANRKYLATTGNLALDKIATEQEFGLDPGYNDYKANPNSRAALLEQTYQEHNRGTMNNAGLQLYSGSTGNRLAANRQGYGLERDQLEKTYRDALNELRDKQAEAASTKGDEETEAAWKNVEHAEEAPLDPTQAPGAKNKKRKRKSQTQAAVGAANALPSRKKRK